MKKVFTMLVMANDTTRMEKLFNMFRIGLNDWDRSKIFDIQGNQVVNYTIVCEEAQFNELVNQMNGTRVY